MRAGIFDVLLPLPCEPSAPSTAAPAAHGLSHGLRHALPHIHRHARHAVHHLARATLRHPKLIVGAACRAAPLLMAASIPAVPLPDVPPPATILQPEVVTQTVQPDPGLPPLPAFTPGFAPASAPAFAYDPVQDVLPPLEVAKLALATPLATPLPGAPVSFIGPVPPAAPTVVPTPGDPVLPQSDVKPVPEPSSLAVFAAALAALRLLRRRRPARCRTDTSGMVH
jgi:hypothetical protein